MKAPAATFRPRLLPGVQLRGLALGRIAALAAAGLVLEALLVVGLLRPLSIWRHAAVVHQPDGLARLLGDNTGGALRFSGLVLAAFAAFGLALWLSRRLHGRSARRLVLAGSVVFALTLIPLNPLGAHDVYHNIFDARIFWLHHGNPTQQPPLAYPQDPLLASVPSWRDTPSAYGPLWYLLAGLPLPFAGNGVWANVVGQKLLVGAFLLGLTWLAMAAAERVRPGSGALAGVLVGWNPLLQFEAAGNGHNDVVMAFFAVAALHAALRRRWLAVFPLLALSAASKEVFAVLGPLLLVYLLSRADVPRRTVALSLAIGVGIVVLLYVPFFAGSDTLAGLGRESDHVTASPGALLYLVVERLHPLRWQLVLDLMKLVAWPAFLIAYALMLRAVASSPRPERLSSSSFWVLFLLLVLLTWWFMPWYLFWLVPLAALTADARCVALAALFSACVMLSYVPRLWLANADALPREAATAAAGFALPVLLALCLGAAMLQAALRDRSSNSAI